jgi:hypothetical protein
MAAPVEARLVAYADKRAGQRLESMEARFGGWRRRYPSGPGEPPPRIGGGPTGAGWGDEVAELVVARAHELEGRICEELGITPERVARLRWSRRALREAAEGEGRHGRTAAAAVARTAAPAANAQSAR